ncbi:hypothetical protein KLP28_12370 [Nocardioidaceae bacterium]|nr:hypothetical protein KLP28_12370 [Nocardioidaceae bacterium]
MASSGIKRGLASTAVAALAVTGAPMLAGVANAVHETKVISQYTGLASIKNDGQNTTIRLEADSAAQAGTTTRFEYRIAAAAGATENPWQTIATVDRNDDGFFSFEWATTLVGVTVDLRAVGISPTGVEDPNAEVREDVQIVGQGQAAESVNLNEASQAGVFQQPNYDTTENGFNVIVSGTTSATGGDVTVSRYTDTTSTGEPTRPTGVQTGEQDFAVTAADGATTGTFKGVYDLREGDAPYNFAAQDPDFVALGAERDSDDVEGYTLYQQTITTVTATANRTNVPIGQTANVTVTVTDQNGNPIAGAEVLDSGANGTTTSKFTNADGQVTYTQGNGTEFYYANATDSDPFEATRGDVRSDNVTVSEFQQAPSSLQFVSSDGSAFDFDENQADDLYVQVKDQNGNNLNTDSQTVDYYYEFTPFSATSTTRRFPTTGTFTAMETDSGRYNLALPPGAESGTYRVFADLNERPVTGGQGIANSQVGSFKAGQATLSYDQSAPVQSTAGGETTVSGELSLEDGTGLPARGVQLDYAEDASTGGTDAQSAAFNQPNNAAGQPQADARSIDLTTDGNGTFSAVLDDPAAPANTAAADETGTVTASTEDRITTTTGNEPDGDPNAADRTLQVQFLANGTTPATVVISGGDADDEVAGELETYTVTVRSANDPATAADESRLLSNQQVTLTTTDGYFTDGVPQGAAGDDTGVFDNDGQTKTVTTNGAGQATFSIAIGRDEGFDDDGQVDATITATSGSASDTQAQGFTSENPINAGEITLEFDDSTSDSSNLPQAQQGDQVNFLVKTFDQFGNRVGGEPFSITSNNPDSDAFERTGTTDYDERFDATLDSTSGEDETVTVSWTNDRSTLAADGGDAGTAPDTQYRNAEETVTDALTVNFYAIDYANSTFTLENNTGDQATVGETVTETYTALDQTGEPIDDLYVEFFRNGPGNSEDRGNGDFDGFTGADGQISYVFTGQAAGDATVTAIGRSGRSIDFNGEGDPGTVQPASQVSDTVTFGAGGGVQDPTITLKGRNNGAKADRLLVQGPRYTAGGTVRLFKTGLKNRPRQLVAVKQSNQFGNVRFRVADRNRKKFTQYRAFLAPSAGEYNRAVSNRRQVR